jgi:hypothetical protein
VVITDVDIISTTATPAAEFVQLSAIADIPLTRRERREMA